MDDDLPTRLHIAVASLDMAIDNLLDARLELAPLESMPVPLLGLDAALRGDAAYREARAEHRQVLAELRVVLGEERFDLVLRVEEAGNAVSVAATDVAFRLGLAVRGAPCQ
ncbi:MAG: hypothetical protein ACOZNI_30100 [Myxococcota bacterium]